jgi:hypothetical protein
MAYLCKTKLRVRGALVFLAYCVVCVSGELWAEELEIAAGQLVSFEQPAGFEAGITRDPDDEFRPQLKFSHFAPSGIKDFGFKVSVHTADKQTLSDKRLALVLMSDLCGRLKAGSAEGKVDIQTYVGKGEVFYCSFTDASLQGTHALAPGSFRKITVAFSRYEEYGFTAIAYSQSTTDRQFFAFLRTVSSLRARASEQRSR